MKHKFGQNKMLPNQENTEETTKQHQIKKHLQKSKYSHNLIAEEKQIKRKRDCEEVQTLLLPRDLCGCGGS